MYLPLSYTLYVHITAFTLYKRVQCLNSWRLCHLPIFCDCLQLLTAYLRVYVTVTAQQLKASGFAQHMNIYTWVFSGASSRIKMSPLRFPTCGREAQSSMVVCDLCLCTFGCALPIYVIPPLCPLLFPFAVEVSHKAVVLPGR